jgi:uncharacterized protein (DUF1015 family)
MDNDDSIRKLIDKSLSTPLIDVKGYDSFQHKLWRLEDETVIDKITEQLKDEILFIADGHHRYQTAINFAQEQQQKTGNVDENAPFNYRMVILANIFDEGLAILPTHRLITMSNLDLSDLLKKLEEYFTVEEKTITIDDYTKAGQQIMKDIKTTMDHKFALYCENKYYLLTLNDEAVMDTFASDRSKTWRTLDVSILHKVILERLMGINEHNLEDHVKYIRENGEALQHVDEGTFDCSFLMNATKIDELKAIADAGEHMPQKSTYFLPKMLSGLVLYKM